MVRSPRKPSLRAPTRFRIDQVGSEEGEPLEDDLDERFDDPRWPGTSVSEFAMEVRRKAEPPPADESTDHRVHRRRPGVSVSVVIVVDS